MVRQIKTPIKSPEHNIETRCGPQTVRIYIYWETDTKGKLPFVEFHLYSRSFVKKLE